MLEFLIENEGSLFALLGVLIGGLLSLISPYISNKMENAKIKRSLKPELVKNIYMFFNCRKVGIQLNNNHSNLKALTSAGRNRINLNIPPMSQQEIDNVETAIKGWVEMSVSETEYRVKQFNDICALEATLYSLMYSIKEHYSDAEFDKVFAIIKPQIDRSNLPSDIYAYASLTLDQLLEINDGTTFDRAVLQATMNLDPDCDRTIMQVCDILKN